MGWRHERKRQTLRGKLRRAVREQRQATARARKLGHELITRQSELAALQLEHQALARKLKRVGEAASFAAYQYGFGPFILGVGR